VTSLGGLLRSVERGEYPAEDLSVTHLPAPKPDRAAVLGFTAHTVIAADVEPVWLARSLPAGDPGAAFNPGFLGALERYTGLRVNNIDVLTLAPPAAGPPRIDLREVEDRSHPRVRRALRYRIDVRVWTCPGGVLTLGRGLAPGPGPDGLEPADGPGAAGDGRWEVAVEVDPACRGTGLGRALAEAARHLVPDNRPIWAEIGVGNAASLRAFLAAGYLPVGEEALLVPR